MVTVMLAAVMGVVGVPRIASAQIPGANGRIVYWADVAGYDDIYSAASDGSDIKRLTHEVPPTADLEPSWSPDGTRIVFTRFVDGTYPGDIVVMNADGSGQTTIVQQAGGDPAWSPPGNRIAFGSNNCICVVDPDGSNLKALTQADDIEPSWSPDAKRIVFARFTNQYDIYVMNADGTHVKQLTTYGGEDVEPQWSPDGTKIVFRSMRTGNMDIFVMNVDGSEQTQLTNDPADDGEPGWAADGSKIAFSSGRSPHGIYTMNPDGSDVSLLISGYGSNPNWQSLQLTLTASAKHVPRGGSVDLTAHLYPYRETKNQTVSIYETPFGGTTTLLTSGTVDVNGDFSATAGNLQSISTTFIARWSGDRRHGKIESPPAVVVMDGRIVFDSNRTGNYEIFSINADGSSVVQLSNNGADDYDANWSPDWTRVAFSSNRGGKYHIWVMDADGSNLTQLTTGTANDADPSWSPDGSKIAFGSDRSGNEDVWTVDVHTGALKQYTFRSGVDEAPSWSPDGSKIAFDSNRNGNFDVYTINADGSNVVQITTSTASDGGASWSPKASTIAFGSNRTGDFEVWTYTIATKKLTRLTTSRGFDGEPSYSPDGSKIAFASTRTGNEQIWVMNSNGSGATQYTKTGNVNEVPDWGFPPLGGSSAPSVFNAATSTRLPDRAPAAHRPRTTWRTG